MRSQPKMDEDIADMSYMCMKIKRSEIPIDKFYS